MSLERAVRATSFHESSLPHLLRRVATWLEDPSRAELLRLYLVADMVVTEDSECDGWWVVVYWYPAEQQRGD